MANEQHLTVGVGVDLTALRRGIASINSSVSKLGQQLAQSFSQSQTSVSRSLAAVTTEALRQQRILAQTAAINQRANMQQARAVQDSANAQVAANNAAALSAQRLAQTQAQAANQQAIGAQQLARSQTQAAQAALSLQLAQARAARSAPTTTNAGSYRALQEQTTQLRRQLLNLPGAFDAITGSINRTNPAALVLQRQIQQNVRTLQSADRQLGVYNRNVGNYGSALSGFKGQLAGLAGGYFTLQAAINAVTGSVKTISTIERQQYALKNASSSAFEYARNLSLAQRIAIETGAPLESTTDALRKFTGATKGTSIEGDKARRIFTAFSNTFTANGASADEFTRATKALSDMMSKGTVSAEELKGQLGDALPGAVKLFADAIGVSQRELLKMMQNGEILAEDILPKVASQLEKTGGDKAQQNLKTISGSFEVLTTNAQLLLAEFNNTGAVSRFFSEINRGIAGALAGFKAVYRQGGVSAILGGAARGFADAITFDAFDFRKEYLDKFKNNEKQDQGFGSFRSATTQQQNKAIQDRTKEIEVQKTKVSDLQKTVNSLNRSYKENWADGGKSYRMWRDNLDSAQAKLREARTTLEGLNNGLIKANRIQAETRKALASTVKLGQKTDKTSPDALVKSIRSQIDSIPDALIGENGKAQLQKDQAKALRGLRDDLLGLYSTLSKADREKLKVDSLRESLNLLLDGPKGKGKPVMTAAIDNLIYDAEQQVKEAQKQIEEAEKVLNRPSTQTTSKNRYTISEDYQIEGLKSLRQTFNETYKAISERPLVLPGSGAFATAWGDAFNTVSLHVLTFRKNVQELSQETKEFIESLGPMGNIFQSLGVNFKDLTDNGKASLQVLGEIGNGIFGSIGSALETSLDALLRFEKQGKKSFKDFAQAALDSLRALFTRLVATAALAAVVSVLTGGASAAGGKGLSFVGAFTKLSGIPKFAEGGVVNKPTLGVFGEAGPEVVFPLSKLHDYLSPQITYAPQGGITNQPIVSYVTTVLEVDGERMAVNTQRHINKRQRYS